MRFLAVLLTAAFLLYPLLVYLGSRWLEPRYLGLAVLSLYLVRGLVLARNIKLCLLVAAAAALAALAVWWLNSEVLLLLVPALINLIMGGVFGYSLYRPPTIPARIARRMEGELTPEAERYTTQVTRVWLGFFCLNGAVAFATALWASQEVWLLYNGVIAYGLMASLFAGEYAYRQLVVKKNNSL